MSKKDAEPRSFQNSRMADPYVYEKGPTKNEQLSKDIEATRKLWKKERWTEHPPEKIKELERKTFVRYFTRDKAGKTVARKGGIIVSHDAGKKYTVLKNATAGVSWSVQWGNLVAVWTHDEPAKPVEDITPDPQPEPEPPKEPAPEYIKRNEAMEILKKLYYDEGATIGRDRLHALAKAKGHLINRRVVEEFLRAQEVYQLTKPSKQKTTVRAIQAKAPGNILQMDLADMGSFEGGDANRWLFMIIDTFTRRLWAIKMRNKDMPNLVAGLRKLVAKIRADDITPRLIMADNEFNRDEIRAVIEELGMKINYSQPGTPQTNGYIERANGTIKATVKKYLLARPGNKWPSAVSKALKIYNATPHSGTGFSPLDAMKPDNWPTVLHNSTKSKGVAPRADTVALNVGDHVRISLKKRNAFDRDAIKWSQEIYEIAEIREPRAETTRRTYRVAPLTGKDKGKPLQGLFVAEELQYIPAVVKPPLADGEYYPLKILKKRRRGRVVEYLVQWRGFSEAQATWERATSEVIQTNPSLVDAFEND